MPATGRPATISYEQVQRACAEIMSEGDTPSFPKVYARIGRRGGGQTVTRFIERFCREIGAAVGANSRPPTIEGITDPRVVKIIQEAMVVAIETAESNLAAGYQERHQELMVARSECNTKVAESERIVREALAKVQQTEASLAVASAEIAARDERISGLRASLEQEIARRNQAEASITSLRDEAAGLARRHEDQILKLQQELSDERERGVGERKLLAHQTDALRQDRANEVAELKRHVKSVQDDASRFAEQRVEEIRRLQELGQRLQQDLSEALAALRTTQAESANLRKSLEAAKREALRLSVKLPNKEKKTSGKSREASRKSGK